MPKWDAETLEAERWRSTAYSEVPNDGPENDPVNQPCKERCQRGHTAFLDQHEEAVTNLGFLNRVTSPIEWDREV